MVLPQHRIAKIEQRVRAAGVRASVDDDRDIVFVPRVNPATVDRIDRRSIFPQVQNQGSLGICTGETMSTICEAIENTQRVYTPGQDERSRRYNYFFSRQYDGLTGDSGATPRSMCRSAKNYGLPLESVWPFNTNIDEVPPQNVIDQAQLTRLGQYELLEFDISNWRDMVYKVESALAEGCLLALAFHVRRWMFYVDGPLGSAGHMAPAMSVTDPLNDLVGGHIVPVVGYDRALHPASSGSLIVQNSWGADWGDNGLWSLNYMQLSAPQFAFEIRVFRGFAGITLAPAPEVPLTLAQIREDREQMQAIGLGTLNADGSFTFAPIPELHYFAGYELLRSKGRAHNQIAQAVGLATADIDGFAAANPDRIAAWRSV